MSFPFDLPLLADGTSSCSELTGEDPDDLCCENIICQTPDILKKDKTKAVEAGVTALLVPTGELMHSRLEELGFDDQFVEFHRSLTAAVRSCAGGRPVGGVVQQNDHPGEEYGKNVFESAYFDHLEKITVLKDAGADFILLKNFDKLWDMRAGVLAARSLDMPVMAVVRTDDEGKTDSDTDYIAALITLQALGADAFGIECSAGAQDMARLLKRALPHAEVPLIAAAPFAELDDDALKELAENGASIYIDLSREHNADKLRLLKNSGFCYDSSTEKDSYAAATYREAFFLPENLELSEPISCGYDMADEIIDLDDSACNAVYISLSSTDDAAAIADNAEMSYLPFVIHAGDPTTLEAALRYYQGRLIVDTRCDIDKEEFDALTAKYGAVLY